MKSFVYKFGGSLKSLLRSTRRLEREFDGYREMHEGMIDHPVESHTLVHQSRERERGGKGELKRDSLLRYA